GDREVGLSQRRRAGQAGRVAAAVGVVAVDGLVEVVVDAVVTRLDAGRSGNAVAVGAVGVAVTVVVDRVVTLLLTRSCNVTIAINTVDVAVAVVVDRVVAQLGIHDGQFPGHRSAVGRAAVRLNDG